MKEKIPFNLHKNVFFSGLVSLFMDISSEMVYPLVPLFLTSVIGAGKTTVGIVEGLAESTASLSKVFSGYLSDILGKRKFLMTLGYAVSAVTRPLLGFSASWTDVLAVRFIDRFGKGIRTSPRDAIISDSTENALLGRAFGFHRSMDTIGAIIGPLVAFLLLSTLWADMKTVFFLSTIPAAFSVFLAMTFIKEKMPDKKEIGGSRLTLGSFDREFKRYVVVITIFSLGSLSDAFLILRAENLGVKRELIPVVYLMFNMIYALSSVPLGFLADKMGLRRMVVFGLILYSAIHAGFAFAYSPSTVWLLFAIYGVQRGISDGAQRAYLGSLSKKETLGTAFGIFHASSGVMLLPAGILAGILWDKIGPSATFLYGSIVSAVSVAILVFPLKKKWKF